MNKDRDHGPHVLHLQSIPCPCYNTLGPCAPVLVHPTGVSLCLSESVFLSSWVRPTGDGWKRPLRLSLSASGTGMATVRVLLADSQQGVRSWRSGRDEETTGFPTSPLDSGSDWKLDSPTRVVGKRPLFLPLCRRLARRQGGVHRAAVVWQKQQFGPHSEGVSGCGSMKVQGPSPTRRGELQCSWSGQR